jgi:hypothetical protein
MNLTNIILGEKRNETQNKEYNPIHNQAGKIEHAV